MDAYSLGPYLPLCILILAYFFYKLHQRRREHEVRLSLITISCHDLTLIVQADLLFGKQHGCQPVKVQFPVKWPFGIDVLRAQLAAITDNRLFAYQQPFIEELGPNFVIKLLGSMGYTTIDPENLEALLSTRFEGI